MGVCVGGITRPGARLRMVGRGPGAEAGRAKLLFSNPRKKCIVPYNSDMCMVYICICVLCRLSFLLGDVGCFSDLSDVM